jgi:hypothetical protein
VLTAPRHERDAQSLVERLGVPAHTPLPDSRSTSWTRTGSPPSRPATAVPTWSGFSAKREGTPVLDGDCNKVAYAVPFDVLAEHFRRLVDSPRVGFRVVTITRFVLHPWQLT